MSIQSTRLRLLATAVVLTGCGGSSSSTPPPPPPSTQERDGSDRLGLVERLLERSGVQSIVSGRAPAFTRQVAIMAGDLTDEELERLVQAARVGFAPERLRADIAGFLADDAPEGHIEEVLAWRETGATAELGRITESYEPPLTLDQFTDSLPGSPPPQERVRLVAEWAEVQGAGEFYLLMAQAIGEAAHAAWAAFRPDAPGYEPLRGDDLGGAVEMSRQAAVVTFLYQLEPVPADVLRGAIDEYGGEAGQWYVGAYTLAVAEAIRAAGRRVVVALEGAGSRR